MKILRICIDKWKGASPSERLCPFLFGAVFFKSVLLQSFFEGTDHFAPSQFEDGGRLLFGLVFGFFSLLLLVSPALLMKKPRARAIFLTLLDAITTLFCVVDVCYYRAFPEMFSFSLLSMAGDAVEEGFLSFGMIGSLLSPWDLLFFYDFLLIPLLCLTGRLRPARKNGGKRAGDPSDSNGRRASSPPERSPLQRILLCRPGIFALTAALCLTALLTVPFLHLFGAANDAYAEIYEPPYLRDVAFRFTPIGYHVYDAEKTLAELFADHTAPHVDPVPTDPERPTDAPTVPCRPVCTATEEELRQIEAFFSFRAGYIRKSGRSGGFQGKNLLFLQIESLENCVIGQTYKGKEITPFLNSLCRGSASSIRFLNLHDQVKSGNSSDCDYMINTGMLPTSKVFFKNFLNKKLLTVPELLRNEGFRTVHINGSGSKCVWDYRTAYRDVFGYDTDDGPDRSFFLLDAKKEEKIKNYLSDEKILSFLSDRLAALEGDRYFVHTVLCSSHMPFTGIYVLPEEDLLFTVPEEERDNKTLAYLNSVHYVDEQLRRFFENAEKEGLLDNTLVAIYGDHKGLHKYYPEDAKATVRAHPELAFLEEERDPTVAFLLYDPSGKTAHLDVDAYGGQIDVMPTVLDLLGIDASACPTVMGRSLLSSSLDYTVTQSGQLLTHGELSVADLKIIRRMYQTANLIVETDYSALFGAGS